MHSIGEQKFNGAEKTGYEWWNFYFNEFRYNQIDWLFHTSNWWQNWKNSILLLSRYNESLFNATLWKVHWKLSLNGSGCYQWVIFFFLENRKNKRIFLRIFSKIWRKLCEALVNLILDMIENMTEQENGLNFWSRRNEWWWKMEMVVSIFIENARFLVLLFCFDKLKYIHLLFWFKKNLKMDFTHLSNNLISTLATLQMYYFSHFIDWYGFTNIILCDDCVLLNAWILDYKWPKC